MDMYGKILIQCDLTVKTGMHIGGSSAFSAIGAVDSPVVRDPLSGLPIVPGSSLKGKIRTLLARSIARDVENMPSFDEDDERVLRLFGSAKKEKTRGSRVQFADCFVKNVEQMKLVGVTEVKSENGIDRKTAVANPRQIERVTAGTVFGVNIVYDVMNDAQLDDDLKLLAKGMKLLQLDYLGGHGSRGSGRVSLNNFRLTDFENKRNIADLKPIFQEVSDFELFSV